MRLQVIGSGSAGNSYLLTASTGERLLVELGCGWNDIKYALDFDYDNVFAIVSHRHGDHSKSVYDACRRGILVCGNDDVAPLCRHNEHNFIRIVPEQEAEFGYLGFTIKAFQLIHDVPTQGYLIHHKECGTICFITDTQTADFDFTGVRHWLIEANFGEDILVDNVYRGSNVQRAERVTEAHMSVEECARVLCSQDLSDTETILLLHLSDANSNEKYFQEYVTKATGRPVYVADKGVIINL